MDARIKSGHDKGAGAFAGLFSKHLKQVTLRP
jgi:hypothetical protein